MSEQSKNNTKSRSMKFSDIGFSNEETYAAKDPKLYKFNTENQMKPETDNDEQAGEFKAVAPKLSRNFSTASHRFRSIDHQRSLDNGSNGGGALQAMVRRAFSMRRPSSLADGYWRIHDTGDEDNGGGVSEMVTDEERANGSSGKKRKGTKFLRACKRFFGL